RGTEGFLLNPINSIDEYISTFYGNYKRISMNLLKVKFILKNGKRIDSIAFNDVFFKNMIPQSGCQGEVNCYGDFGVKFDGDGIIIATPQGTTAYTRAAGGHILSLRDKILAVTSICGFAMPVKSITTAKEIEVSFSKGKIDGVADNRRVRNIEKAFITVMPNAVQLGFMKGYDFEVMRYKKKLKRN
ncbi:hypothetical protein K8R32_03440, partial [bacterium]|nr:hypothetical protein [bacterium]